VVGHAIGGKDMASLAHELGSSPGGIAVQLARASAKLRVDYLVGASENGAADIAVQAGCHLAVGG
jgi:hypothetical protein